jgi:hypothetical protein
MHAFEYLTAVFLHFTHSADGWTLNDLLMKGQVAS